MRLIDADALENILKKAIEIQEQMTKLIDVEDDEGIQMELKAYREILEDVREQPTVYGKCEDCARNANNGILYPDGRTRCPIQEYYTLLKDGCCHLFSECIDE